MRILHTNDLHGCLNDAKRDRLAQLREGADFYFDTGDAIKTGNIGIPVRQEPVWAMFASLGCTAGVPGNREFHIAEVGLQAKIEGCKHPLLAANLRYKSAKGKLLQEPRSGSFALGEDRPLMSGIGFGEVGVFGVMVPMVTAKMSARHVSAFINDPPIASARECVKRLRETARVVVCLSHLGLGKDKELAEAVDGIDLVLGGHSHDVVDPPLRINDTWIVQAGSHGRFAGMYEYEKGSLKAAYEQLP